MSVDFFTASWEEVEDVLFERAATDSEAILLAGRLHSESAVRGMLPVKGERAVSLLMFKERPQSFVDGLLEAVLAAAPNGRALASALILHDQLPRSAQMPLLAAFPDLAHSLALLPALEEDVLRLLLGRAEKELDVLHRLAGNVHLPAWAQLHLLGLDSMIVQDTIAMHDSLSSKVQESLCSIVGDVSPEGNLGSTRSADLLSILFANRSLDAAIVERYASVSDAHCQVALAYRSDLSPEVALRLLDGNVKARSLVLASSPYPAVHERGFELALEEKDYSEHWDLAQNPHLTAAQYRELTRVATPRNLVPLVRNKATLPADVIRHLAEVLPTEKLSHVGRRNDTPRDVKVSFTFDSLLRHGVEGLDVALDVHAKYAMRHPEGLAELLAREGVLREEWEPLVGTWDGTVGSLLEAILLTRR